MHERTERQKDDDDESESERGSLHSEWGAQGAESTRRARVQESEERVGACSQAHLKRLKRPKSSAHLEKILRRETPSVVCTCSVVCETNEADGTLKLRGWIGC